MHPLYSVVLCGCIAFGMFCDQDINTRAELRYVSGAMQDISIVTGDPVKFGLGLVSIIYCVVLLIQHYGLYRDRKPSHYSRKPDSSEEPAQPDNSLLPNRRLHDSAVDG